MKESIFTSVFGIIFGIVILVFGFVVLDKVESDSKVESHTTFGGDFYTYEFSATRVAAKNTETMAKGIGYILLAIGGISIISFAGKLLKKPVNNYPYYQYSAANTPQQMPNNYNYSNPVNYNQQPVVGNNSQPAYQNPNTNPQAPQEKQPEL